MKKLILLGLLGSFSFSATFACKNESDLYLIADSTNRVNVAQDLIYDGKCKILNGGTVIHKGKYTTKIRYGSEIYYTLNAYLE